MATTVYDKSIFKKYFDSNDTEVVAWVDNVVNKLFQQGIVPNYIERGQGNANVDGDYNAYWTMVVTFLAYFVKLSRVFENFRLDSYLAAQYLINLNSFINSSDSLIKLQYTISNRLRDISRRGTSVAYTQSTNANIPDGEILRLINYFHGADFFKLGTARPQYNSWNVGNSGPLSRGCTRRYDLNLGYEWTEDVVSLSPYPIINLTYTSLSSLAGKGVMQITGAPLGVDAGIGLADFNKRISINPNQNFEITFDIAQNTNYSNISFGVLVYGPDDSLLTCKKVTDNSPFNFFFQNQKLNQTNQFYSVRGILYNKDQATLSADDARLNIGYGQNLILPVDAAWVIPYIVINNSVSTAGAIYLWNIKVTPCSTVYNRCFLNNKNFVDIFMTNRGGNYTNAKVNDILRRYFIPNDTAFKSTFLDIIPVGFIAQETGDLILQETGDFIKIE